MRRRRGGLKSARAMSKKATPAVLQTGVCNDEEWAKLLTRPGLVVVDVYAEWSGPCSGMVSVLKKIKMEIGGDTLSYATAKCDFITDLARFQGKSEPTWIFLHNGRMVNLLFGANCPHLLNMITTELRRVQNGEEHEFSLEVSERSVEENTRLQMAEEARHAKAAAKKSRKEAEAIARYENEMFHYTSSLRDETCLLLYPWVFKDEQSHRRDKKASPPYIELCEELLPENYTIEQEIRKRLNDEILQKLFLESEYVLPESAKSLLFDGKCMFMCLKIDQGKETNDVHSHLINLLFGLSELPDPETPLEEECFATKHRPAFITTEGGQEFFPIVWTPPNPRNKAMVFRTIFATYTNNTYPYEDKSANVPIVVFKYDYTRKNDLRIVTEEFEEEILNFGIFESDKPPDAKIIATSIKEFEINPREKTGYETFVYVVKKVGCEAFLGFAGIGPYHVSENSEKAIEESRLYFPNVTPEDSQSEDEEKLEEMPETEESNNPEVAA